MGAEAECALGPLQHQVFHRTGTAQFSRLARAEAGEHGHRQDAHAGVRGQGRLDHRRIAVHGGEGDAAAGELLHRQPHRGRDVVQLEVEHHLAAAADDVVHHRPAAGKEQLQADLEEADPFGQPVDQGQGRGRVGQVEGEDDALLQGDGQSVHAWILSSASMRSAKSNTNWRCAGVARAMQEQCMLPALRTSSSKRTELCSSTTVK